MLRCIVILSLFIISVRGQSQLKWELFPEIPGEADLNAVSIAPDGKWYCMGLSDLYSSADAGKTWTFEISHGISLYRDIKMLKFLEDGTPVLGKNNNYQVYIKRDHEWVVTDINEDFETFRDTLYGIKGGYVQKSYDKGLTWHDHLKVSGMTIYRYRQHHNRHYIEYATDNNRKYGEITPDGTILRWRWGVDSDLKLFAIDDCDNIHYIYRDKHSLLYADGTNDYKDLFDDRYSFVPYKDKIYRFLNGRLYSNIDCGSAWQLINTFNKAQEFHPIGRDTLMVVFDSTITTIKLPDTILAHHVIKNVPLHPWAIEEIPDGSRFVFTNNGHYKIHADNSYETISWSILSAQFGPTGWIYLHNAASHKVPFSKDGGVTWDTLSMPDGTDPFLTHVYPVTEQIISFSGFEGTIMSLPDGSLHHLPSDIINGLDHFYTTYRKVGNLILMRENITGNISGFDLITKQFLPLLYQNTTGWSYSNIDAEGTLYRIEQDNEILTVSPYPYTDFKSVTLPDEVLQSATLADKGIVIVFGQSAYHYDKNLTYTKLDLGPMEGLSFFELFATKSGRWIMSTASSFHPAYQTTTTFPESHLGSLIKGDLIATDQVCDSISIMSGTNWKFQFRNTEYEFVVLGRPGGELGFNLPEGMYDVKTFPPYYELWEACQWPSEISVDGSPILDFNFLTQFKEDCHAGEIVFSAPFYRRCFQTVAYVIIRNVGVTTLESANLRLLLPDGISFVSSPFSFTLDNGDYILPVPPIAPGEYLRISVTFYVDCNIDLGLSLCAGVALEGLTECSALPYSDELCMEVIGSWDPNDKHATNEHGTDRATFQKEDFIYYKVNFQNTGTDTAFTVKVVDELDASLDLLTFEMVSSSHDMNFHFEGRELVVEFENIRLPDSTRNLIGSNGFFEYRIKMDSSFAANDTIFNQAGIVFDFNEPILTNIVPTTLDLGTSLNPVSFSTVDFALAPNPASTNITVRYPNNGRAYSISIYNLYGRQNFFTKTSQEEVKVDIGNFPEGMYLMKILDNDKTGVRKFAVVASEK